jgi:predicted Rossmann-fold nucleotide-binding protein
LNVRGYYRHVVEFLDYAVDEGFLKPQHRALLVAEEEPVRLFDRFESLIEMSVPRRFDRGRT